MWMSGYPGKPWGLRFLVPQGRQVAALDWISLQCRRCRESRQGQICTPHARSIIGGMSRALTPTSVSDETKEKLVKAPLVLSAVHHLVLLLLSVRFDGRHDWIKSAKYCVPGEYRHSRQKAPVSQREFFKWWMNQQNLDSELFYLYQLYLEPHCLLRPPPSPPHPQPSRLSSEFCLVWSIMKANLPPKFLRSPLTSDTVMKQAWRASPLCYPQINIWPQIYLFSIFSTKVLALSCVNNDCKSYFMTNY